MYRKLLKDMLDLKKLEEKLDFALSQEAAESLGNWFESRRELDRKKRLESITASLSKFFGKENPDFISNLLYDCKQTETSNTKPGTSLGFFLL